MGWWGYYDVTKENLMQVIADREVANCDILYHSKKGNTIYMACKFKSSPGMSEEMLNKVFAIVVLISISGNETAFKTMDESMGPSYYDPPKKLLDMLTPTDDKYANQWRDKCKETQRRKSLAASIKPGSIIEFDEPISFSGEKVQIFKYYGKNIFGYSDSDEPSFKILTWKSREYKILQDR